MLGIIIVQSNDHVYPEHLRNIFAVSFVLKVSTSFVFCELLLSEVLEATERQEISYFLCQDFGRVIFHKCYPFWPGALPALN